MPIKLNGSTSGYTQIQAAAVATNNTLTLPTTGTNLLSDTFTGDIAITGNETVSGNMTVGGDLIPSSSFLRNRIINGAMVIDQRNAGASVTPTDAFTLDRWISNTSSVAGKFSVQQNAGSVTPPVGFKNYLGVTSLSAYTVGAAEYFLQSQYIEGFNVYDLNWGTANAQTITLSFWVRSSLTGTFGGALNNNAGNRSYPFTYTISVANTWEYKTITIAGDTTGTWATDNTRGIAVRFGLGVGSTFSGTAGSWSSSTYYSATGATSVVGTNAATFYITGVQLEVGSNATPFERRLYGQELMLCQRYYEHSFGLNAPSNGADATTMVSTAVNITPVAAWGGTTPQNTNIRFLVSKRATPTMTSYGNSQGYWGYLTSGATLPTSQNTYTFSTNVNPQGNDINSFRVNQQLSQSILWGVAGGWTASAEL